MTDFDDILKDAWKGEVPPATHVALDRRVRRQRLLHRLQRSVEVALTLAAVLVFGHALVSGRIGPTHWLMLPFYVVFLPVAWTVILGRSRGGGGAAADVQSYAQLRLVQLRTGLHDLWLARVTARSLLAYAIVVAAGTWALADAGWRDAALALLGASVAWRMAVYWLGRARCRALLREYRAMKGLAGS